MATTPTLQDEVAFISGVTSGGTLAQQAYFTWSRDAPATYSNTSGARKWGGTTPGTPGGTVYFTFNPASNWTSTEQQWLGAGLALWSAFADITFVKTTDAKIADITFARGSDGSAMSSMSVSSGPVLDQLNSAVITIDTRAGGFGPINGFSAWGGYPIETLLHEEGHALGLGHAGPYNGAVDVTTQQFSAYDTRLWSIMSYIDPGTRPAKYSPQYPVTGTNFGGGYPTTPMQADILAIQRLYGVATTTPLSGGQTFGFNCNIAGAIRPFYDFTKNTRPVITIWDKGPNNTLDLSGFAGSATVNLNPGTFSSTCGLKNNIAIAYGTAVDTLVCGSGATTVICNNNGDTVLGGNGDDNITGGTGNDTLTGGNGINLLDGGSGKDIAIFAGNATTYTVTRNSNGTTTVMGAVSTDTLSAVEVLQFADRTISLTGPVPRDFDGDYRSDLLLVSGGKVQVWLLNGTITRSTATLSGPGSGWTAAATGDFNADGHAEILWRNSGTGALTIWATNGRTKLSSTQPAVTPGVNWKVLATADFNYDGTSDILFQNGSQVKIWLMNGSAKLSGSGIVAKSAPSGFRFAATGDFDGNGKCDILWQNPSTGQLDIWFLSGSSLLSTSAVASNPGTGWRAAGTGDFNADGRSDVLLQSSTGQAAVWLMNGATKLSGANAGSNLGSSWKAVTVGDYSGDGTADILFQNTATGQLGVQLLAGTATPLSTGLLTPIPGLSWHAMAG